MFMRAAIALSFVLVTAGASAADFAVIVNNENKVTSLSSKDVASCFLKKKSQWDGGVKVVPVVLPDASGATTSFDKQILGRTASAVRAFWQQEIFSGRNVPPVEKESDDEIVAFVLKTPGAIGYISGAAAHPGVRVVAVTE